MPITLPAWACPRKPRSADAPSALPSCACLAEFPHAVDDLFITKSVTENCMYKLKLFDPEADEWKEVNISWVKGNRFIPLDPEDTTKKQQRVTELNRNSIKRSLQPPKAATAVGLDSATPLRGFRRRLPSGHCSPPPSDSMQGETLMDMKRASSF